MMHVFQRLIGIVPLGVGLTVIISLWSAPFGQFGSPPLFFRVFGSFVALFFLLIGGALVFGAASPENLSERLKQMADAKHKPDRAKGGAKQYVCASCSAPLDRQAEVSPLGDVKCRHCGRWFNIHA